MKLRIKLFGTFRQNVPGYDPEQGLEIEVQDPAQVSDVLAQLGIPLNKGAVVSVDNRIAKLEDEISENARVSIIQKAYGG